MSKTFGFTFLACCFLAGGIARAQEALKPVDPHARSTEQIIGDFEKSMEPLRAIFSPETLIDPAKRKDAASKYIAPLKDSTKYLTQLRAGHDAQGVLFADQIQPQINLFLVVFGDQATREELEKQSKGTDRDAAASARVTLLMSDWVLADKNADKQKAMIETAKQLARDYPTNDQVTQLIFAMGRLGAGSPALADAIQDVAASMKSAAAAEFKDVLDSMRKLREMENKPLNIEGLTFDGKKLSTADWKGKVILVDFWATWCAPCRAALPSVKKTYAALHDKGLEVLGVSCDDQPQALEKFLATNKDVPWPQLFDPLHAGWHPLATQYGIRQIPTMFLIDKNGILRSTAAEEDFQEMIPKLLEEKN